MLIKLIALVIILGLFIAVWRIESGWRIIITPFLLVIYFEFIRVLPPFFLADVYGVTNSPLPLLAATMAFVSTILGFLFSYLLIRVGRRNAESLSATRIPSLTLNRADRAGVFALVGVLIVCGWVFYGGLPITVRAVVGLLTGGHEDWAVLVGGQRFLLTKGAYFGEEYRGQGVISIVQRTGWTLVCSYALLVWLDRRTLFSVAAFVSSILGAWIFVAGDGTRGAFLNILIVVAAVYSLRRALNVRLVVIGFLGICVIAILLGVYSNKMYNLLMSSEGGFLQEATSRILERIFLANGMNDVRVIELVNTGVFQLRWGENHLRDVIAAIPGVQYGIPLSHELFQLLNPDSRATTFFSGTYLSDVYIDFGWYGIFPLFFLAGGAIGLSERWLMSTDPNPWKISVSMTLAVAVVYILRSGFTGFIAQVVVIAALVGIHAFVSKISRPHRRFRPTAIAVSATYRELQ